MGRDCFQLKEKKLFFVGFRMPPFSKSAFSTSLRVGVSSRSPMMHMAGLFCISCSPTRRRSATPTASGHEGTHS